MVACRQVFVTKQSGYGEVIAWLEGQARDLGTQKDLNCRSLVSVVDRVSR